MTLTDDTQDDNEMFRRIAYLTHRRRTKVGYDQPYQTVTYPDIATRQAFQKNLAKYLDENIPEEIRNQTALRLAVRTDRFPW